MRGMAWWKEARSRWNSHSLTLLAKTGVMLSAELVFNAFMWIIAVIVFTRQNNQHKILPLALVAWTTGLRHGLDADHISAIDNATRRIVSVPLVYDKGVAQIRRPVTVGFFFSLGHSTIVVATITAIAISAKVASNLDGFGNVGSVVGPAISGSFLILIGCINTYILHKTWSRIRSARREQEEKQPLSQSSTHRFNGIMTRLAMPLLRTVDRSWKLYPVGILFGLGFDTASSIALLSVAVIAQQESSKDEKSGDASVILLALLFTAGMTLVDSIDSCLMIWAYAPDLTSNGKIAMKIWESSDNNILARSHNGEEVQEVDEAVKVDEIAFTCDNEVTEEGNVDTIKKAGDCNADYYQEEKKEVDPDMKDQLDKKEDTISDKLLETLGGSASHLSLVLTLLSVIIAFAVGIIELLGLIGQECSRCSRAANEQEMSGNGGLEGRWWLTWRRANDNFGYIGAAIIGLFTVCVTCYFTTRWWLRKRQAKKHG